MTQPARPKRLDERVSPGWANLATNLLRYGGIVVGALLIWFGFLTGGFFLLLTGVLAAIAIVGGWLLGSLIQRESWYESDSAQLKTLALVVGFPVAILVFAQLAGPYLTPEPNKFACFAGTPARNGELHTDLAVDPRIKSMKFTMTIGQVSGGALRWFVQDPTGQSRWTDRYEVPGTFTSDAIPGMGGTWRINVISEADSVSYAIAWNSVDPPPAASGQVCAPPL
jgi:hypothetical protein